MPAVPVKVDVGLEGAATAPPVPLTILQLPMPTLAVLAASVTVVDPQVVAPVWSGPALATVGKGVTVIATDDEEAVQGALLIVQVKV